MKKLMIISIVLISILVSFSAQAQMVIKKAGGEGGDIFFINELAAIVAGKDKSIKVEHAMPVDNRPEGYRDIEIKQDDEILMVNKKRIKTVSQLQAIYDEAETGETIKFGMCRGEEMFIIEFAKMDPEKMGKRKMMVMTKTIDSGECSDKVSTKIFSNKMMLDDSEGPIEPLLGIGLFLQEKNGKVFVIKNMENFEETKEIQDGSEVISINGQKTESLNQVTNIFKELETGEEVTLKISTEEKEAVITFQKPEAKARKIIRKERN
ncbi:hypothetical protein H8E88_04890 [candidate division KSB1 bacterium]|nr:hypothetical protein [candidate division KSB1 bacterium]